MVSAEEFLTGARPESQNNTRQTAEDFLSDVETPGTRLLVEAPAPVQEHVAETQNQYERLAAGRYSPEAIENIKNQGPIGFWEARRRLEPEQVLPGGGLIQGGEAFYLANISKKIQAGEQLTPMEEGTMDAFIYREVETGLRGYSVGGQIMNVLGMMPAFAVEFAATGGVGKAAQVAATKGVQKGLKNAVLAKTAGITANVAARAAAMPAPYVAKFGERRLNDYVAITDKGEAIFQESTESPAKSAMMAMGHHTAEVASEMSGAAIGKYVVTPAAGVASRYLRTPVMSGINKIPAGIRTQIYTAYQKMNPNARVSKIFTAGGWNGVLEEMGEERIAAILQGGVDLVGEEDFGFEEYLDAVTPTGEQLLVEAAVMSIAGGVKGSANIATNLLTEKLGDPVKAKETVDNMSATEQEAFVNGNLALKPAEQFRSLTLPQGLKELSDIAKTSSSIDEFFEKTNAQEQDPFYDDAFNYYRRNFVERAERTGGGLTPTVTVDGYDDIDVIAYNMFKKDADAGIFDGVSDPNQLELFEDNARHFQEPLAQAQLGSANQLEPPQINNEESTFERVRRDWDDDMRPIQKLVKEAEAAGAEITSGKDPYKLARQFRKIGGMAEAVLNHNTYYLDENGNGVITGKSMRSILEDYDAAIAHIETNRDSRKQDFDDYLIARRINEDLIPNPDIEVSAKDAAMAEATMTRLSDKYGEEMAWFKQFSDEFYDFKRRVLNDFLVREGVITEDFANVLQEKHARHVPFERVFEENNELDQWMPKQFTKASSRSIIKKMFGGSERDIKSPTEATMRQVMKIISTAHRNRVAREVAGLSDFVPHMVQKVATPMKKITVTDPDTGKEIETYRPTGQAPRDTITAYIDGKPQYYQLSKPLLEAMEGMPQSQLAGVWRAMQILSGAPLLTRGATRYNPDFIFKNIVRDQLQAVIMSKARPIPFVDLSKGIAANMGKSEYHQEWLMGGGKMSSFMDLSDNAMEKAMKELMDEKSSKLRYLNPLNIIGDTVDFGEQATRLGVNIKAKQQGMTDIDAALESLEASVDFTRGGRVSKVVNKFVPFFNAGVQGTTKFVRAFKQAPIETAMWATATITIPNLMVTAYYLYSAPDEDREEYLEFPEWVHALSTPVKIGNTWFYVPKPFAPGYIFGSMPQMFMIWMHKNDKPEGREFALQMASGAYGAMTPWYDESSLLPTSVRVLIENTTNHSFFLGRDIYPSWLERALPEDQVNSYTTETARLLGDGLDASPAIIDNTLRGYLGGSARYITDAGDWLINDIKRARGEDVPEDPASVKNIPIVRSFSHRTPLGYRSESSRVFFERWERVSAAHTSFKKKSAKDKAEFQEEYGNELRAYRPMKKFYDRMRKLSKQTDAIYEDPSMTGEEKADALEDINRVILEVAQDANKWYKENAANTE